MNVPKGMKGAKAKRDEPVATPAQIAEARTNQFGFYPFFVLQAATNLGKDVFTAINQIASREGDQDPPPVVAKKMNLPMLMDWLSRNAHRVRGKKN